MTGDEIRAAASMAIHRAAARAGEDATEVLLALGLAEMSANENRQRRRAARSTRRPGARHSRSLRPLSTRAIALPPLTAEEVAWMVEHGYAQASS